MNCRPASVPACVVALLGVCVGASGAAAQTPPSLTMKQATTLSAADKAALAAFVTAATGRLAKDEPAGRTELELAGQAGNQPCSPAYYNEYAQVLNKELIGIATNPSLRVRLNAAFVAWRVAEQAGNVQLAGAVIAFMKDKSDPVALWGAKGARPILYTALERPAAGQQPDLLPQLAKTVAAHKDGPLAGSIAAEAYNALVLGLNAPGAPAFRAASKEMIAAVVPEIQRAMDERVRQFVKGVPQEPTAELWPTAFLTDQRVWEIIKPGTAGPDLQAQSIQVLSDLLSAAAQRFDAPAAAEERDPLARVVSQTAKAISVTPKVATDRAARDAIDPLTKVTATTSGVGALAAKVQPALSKIPQFSKLKSPPTIAAAGSAAPATAPASAPAP